MGKKRDRYIVSGSLYLNDKNLNGLALVDLGPCGFGGITKSSDGSKLLKSDLKYNRFRVEDPKAAKELGLTKGLHEFTFSKKDISVFLSKQEDNT